jgi:peptide/nickel transport system substrate-binding protein
MKKHRLLGLAVGVTAVAMALTGCGGTAGGSSASGGDQVLTIGMPNGSQTNNSNPFIATSSARSLGYVAVIYEPLAQVNTVNPTEAATPWLATDWTWNDAYTEISFTIREGVKWSDGQDLTPADVAYSLNLRKDNPAINSDALPFDTITVDGNTVKVTFKASQFVTQLKVLNLTVVPEHIWKDIKDPTTDLNQNPVGSGPYTLDNWTAQAVSLKTNPNYWGTKPSVPELRYTSYNDNTALTTALVNGDAQWGWTFIADYKTVYNAKDPEHNLSWFPTGLAVDALYLNTAKAPFDNVALRKAVSMVIDRNAISTQATSGVSPAIESPIGLPAAAAKEFAAPEFANDSYKVDVDGAKKVLADAGYTLTSDGALVDPAGNPVTFTLTNPSGWSDYLTGLQIISESVKPLGITAEVSAMNADSWLTSIATGDFQASMHWTDSGSTPWTLYSNIMDGAQYVPIGETANWNFGRFQSPEATAALAAYANATDDTARAAALATLQGIQVEQVPAIPVLARPALSHYSTKNFTGWPDDADPYAAPDPTQNAAAKIILNLKPVASK